MSGRYRECRPSRGRQRRPALRRLQRIPGLGSRRSFAALVASNSASANARRSRCTSGTLTSAITKPSPDRGGSRNAATNSGPGPHPPSCRSASSGRSKAGDGRNVDDSLSKGAQRDDRPRGDRRWTGRTEADTSAGPCISRQTRGFNPIDARTGRRHVPRLFPLRLLRRRPLAQGNRNRGDANRV